jgi:purine-binding chemotaxis protein CheW
MAFASDESHPVPRRGRGKGAYQREVLTFALGDEEHGIDILRMREIIRPRPVTEVPRAPAFILGVIGVRGEVLPVLDLRQRLRKAPRPGVARDARVLIVVKEGEAFGLLVDAVHQVVRLREEDVEPPPPLLGSGDSELIAGIARPYRDRLIILLDLDAVVTFSIGARP